MRQITAQIVEQMDQNDELASFKKEFYTRDESIYLDGNSLGLLSKRAEQSLFDVLNDWKEHGIDGWMVVNTRGLL